ACQQADAVAEVIARAAGAPIEPRSFKPVLRGQLITGRESRFMRTNLSGREGDSAQTSPETLWWPPSKVAGRYLAPYLHETEAAAEMLVGSPRKAAAGLGLFALSPIPSAQLFIAAGLLTVRLLPLTVAFFA